MCCRDSIELCDFKGSQVLTPPEPALQDAAEQALDLKDIKGQETASRDLGFSFKCAHQRTSTSYYSNPL